jgi:hypothetical protein
MKGEYNSAEKNSQFNSVRAADLGLYTGLAINYFAYEVFCGASPVVRSRIYPHTPGIPKNQCVFKTLRA